MPKVIGTRIDPTSYVAAARQVVDWAQAGGARYVCAANVHMVMEAYDSAEFQGIVNAADLVTPDGMPLVWMLRRLGYPEQQRVYGPDLTLYVAREAAASAVPVGLYGSSPETLRDFQQFLAREFPGIQVKYAYSPPFRELTADEDARVVDEIASSGVRILFVGLGCPKQERWMAAHIHRLDVVMLGVGVAFDFHAGKKAQAPGWMQRIGLEWLFRLLTEPRRLWYRYLYHNPRFIFLAMLQLLFKRP